MNLKENILGNIRNLS